MKEFARLSEIEKNALRLAEEPSLLELYPFLKMPKLAEGGMVPESFGLANILAV